MASRYAVRHTLGAKPDVFLCRDTCTDTCVVVKRNDTSSLSADTDDTECKLYHLLHAAGGHPHILPLLDSFHDGDHAVALVLDYCPHGDLFDLVLANKRIDVPVAVTFFGQLASAVAALHALGYAHGDLSLENVLLGRHMQVQLMDFGAAVPIDIPTTQVAGKCNYMAPELFSGLPWDPAAADVWALGMTLFAMLTGDFLLDDSVVQDPLLQILAQHGLRGVLQLMPRWHALLPEAVVPLLEQMLQVDPRVRISMSAVLQYAQLLLSLVEQHHRQSPTSPSNHHDKRHKIMRPRTLYRFNDIYARPSASVPTASAAAFVHCV
ncbi:Aste57867_14848 [Aphanomyces stellatus]|uniref:Aste57867_14848 protein n=1 Tax=Aphanomyces stellatus TaxID=120398 RepID=A0A485L207_9STRA|nr:hypothetical protein As57867_014792 [Aphanomyces stellatus]VFT91666.1 Aste57867_14848 [Aphanomyces stellatus]